MDAGQHGGNHEVRIGICPGYTVFQAPVLRSGQWNPQSHPTVVGPPARRGRHEISGRMAAVGIGIWCKYGHAFRHHFTQAANRMP